MWTLGAAIFAAVASFIFKIFVDIRAEHQARRALAAAIAGELSAQLEFFALEGAAEAAEAMMNASRDDRAAVLKGLFSLPTSHPVFDRVADRIGSLSPEAAQGISKAYNNITFARLILNSLSSEAFLEAPDHVQVSRYRAMISRLEADIEGMQKSVALLDRLSQQTFLNFLMGRG